MNRDEFNKEIDSIKEVLSNMPQNNKKNKLKYLEYIKENIDIYKGYENSIINEINKRNEEIEKRIGKRGIDFSNKDEECNQLLEELYDVNIWNTPYEKIGLDRIIYEINHYYKDNLDAMNSDIKDALGCFDMVGVKLKSSDFNFSKYVNQYMDAIINDDSKVKSKIDELFWKSPNMINGIAMNFNYLYIKYEKYFINYYKNKTKEIGNINDVKLKYNNLLDDIYNSTFYIGNIVDKFLSGELNVKDYSIEKLESYTNSLGIDKLDMESLDKLYSSLYEYKMYKEYKFIIDKVIELYKNKSNYKNSYKNLLKDINKIYSKIFKINKKINSKWFNNKSKNELLEIEVNNTLEELRDKDSNLCIEKVNEVISTLNDSTSYYDILNLIGFNYVYFRSIILEVDEGISYEDIVKNEEELKKFLCSKYNSILNNVKVLDDVNISQVISDRYRLLNINLSDEDIDNNFDNYMDIIEKIKIIKAIDASKVSYEELLFLVNIKDIIKK